MVLPSQPYDTRGFFSQQAWVMNWLKNAQDLNLINSFLEYNNIIELKSKMVGLN